MEEEECYILKGEDLRVWNILIVRIGLVILCNNKGEYNQVIRIVENLGNNKREYSQVMRIMCVHSCEIECERAKENIESDKIDIAGY